MASEAPDTRSGSSPERYEAVIFDNDGVLVELTDEGVLRDAIRATFDEFSVDPADEDVEAMLGVTVDDLEEVCTRYDLVPEDFWFARDMNASEAQRREISEGRKELYDDVATLLDLDRRLGIVSNNQQRTVDFVLEYYELADLFDPVYGREPTIEGIERKKPASYYLERAVADLGTERVLYVGDSAVDVLAASEVGIDCAFLRRDHRFGYDLPARPTYELDGLSDLPAVLDAGPERDAFRPG